MRIVIVTPETFETIWRKLLPQERIMAYGNVLVMASLNALIVIDEQIDIMKLGKIDEDSASLVGIKQAIREGGFNIYKTEG